MADKFIVQPKKAEKKDVKSVVVTLRMDEELQEAFEQLAKKSNRSRNEVMCMALRYALDNLEFLPDERE